MAECTGGELLVRCLANEGIDTVFGLPCPEVDPILARLESHGIRLMPIRHEAAGAHMAEGLYKTTGKVAAVLGNPGPGSANLLAGVITALHEGVPLVVITAQHRLGIVYPSPPSTFQGQDQLDVFRPAVKWGGPILAWDRIVDVTRIAFREMWRGRPGPVHLEIPAPVLYDVHDDAPVRVIEPGRYRAGPPRAPQAQLERAAELLAGARRPIVIAGSGVDRAGANSTLMALVERLGCPVLPTMAGRATVRSDHPNYLHGYGAGGDLARKEADVVLVAGSRLGNLDLPYDKYWGDGSGQAVIQIDVDQRNIGVSRPVALAIVADVSDALDGIVRALAGERVPARDGADLARYRKTAAAWWEGQLAATNQWAGAGIHPAHAMRAIGKEFGSESIYVTDGGNTSLWAHWYLPPTAPRSYLSILELGMLGTGIPSAVGAKLGNPERQVVCVTGDGAAGFHVMEMQSAAREGLALTTVVFAEGSWTMEEPNERMLYGRTFGTAMGDVRWDKVAEGLGCDGSYVETLDGLAPALARARASRSPSLICLRTDRDANLAVPNELLMKFIEVYQGPLG